MGSVCALAQGDASDSPFGNVAPVDQLRAEIVQLRRQKQTLSASLIEAKEAEEKAAKELAEVKLLLTALGKNLFDGGNERLVQAASDLQILQERLSATEKAALALSSAAQHYASEAVVSDPSARLNLEVSSRELDKVLGLREKPQPDIKAGSIHRAEVISIDSESGLILINSGYSQNLRIGMNYSLQRGEQAYGKAVIAEIRENVSGAFVEQLNAIDQKVQIGDTLVLNTEAR
jgi:vacuolar-type H+-ATPase subunit I/STV1